jgi:hypothetical protein
MATSIQEIYTTSIRPLKENEKLQLATLILEEVTQLRRRKQLSDEEKVLARRRLRQFAGGVSSGNPNSSDNEQIDRDLALECLNPHEDNS